MVQGKLRVMRVNCAWQKFRELSPILTVKGVSLKSEGHAVQIVCRVLWCRLSLGQMADESRGYAETG